MLASLNRKLNNNQLTEFPDLGPLNLSSLNLWVKFDLIIWLVVGSCWMHVGTFVSRLITWSLFFMLFIYLICLFFFVFLCVGNLELTTRSIRWALRGFRGPNRSRIWIWAIIKSPSFQPASSPTEVDSKFCKCFFPLFLFEISFFLSSYFCYPCNKAGLGDKPKNYTDYFMVLFFCFGKHYGM